MKKLFLLLLPIAVFFGIISTAYSAYETFIGNGPKWNVVEFIILFILTIGFLVAYLQVKNSNKQICI